MANIYFPSQNLIVQRNINTGSYTEMVISILPNVVFFFDTASTLRSASNDEFFLTASYAKSASFYNFILSSSYASSSFSSSYSLSSSYTVSSSYALSSSFATTASLAINAINGGTTLVSGSTYNITASYAVTASFATNAAGAGTPTASAYNLTFSSSLNWITASFFYPEQYFFIPSGSVTYNFTASNLPVSGSVSNTSLFVYNTANTTCSLAFPASWIFMGIVPTYLTSSKSAILSLKAFGTGQIVAAWGQQY